MHCSTPTDCHRSCTALLHAMGGSLSGGDRFSEKHVLSAIGAMVMRWWWMEKGGRVPGTNYECRFPVEEKKPNYDLTILQSPSSF